MNQTLKKDPMMDSERATRNADVCRFKQRSQQTNGTGNRKKTETRLEVNQRSLLYCASRGLSWPATQSGLWY